ncbi:MAG TPA: hypothetical protein VLV83_14935, partial [Acidobacteriota bacterium]|nr:hypothetical protein [Acidobacteriota bacterium]
MRKRGSTSNLSRRVDWLDTGADPVTLLGRTVRINYPDGGVEHRYFSDLQPSALHHETGQSVFPGGTQLPLRSK